MYAPYNVENESAGVGYQSNVDGKGQPVSHQGCADTTEFVMVKERSCMGDAIPGRKSSSVLSGGVQTSSRTSRGSCAI